MNTILGHEHDFDKIVRRNGNRVRYQCSLCMRIGPWVRFLNTTPETDVEDEAATAPENKTVTQLRADCKAAGIRGYSMMNKSELLTALSGVR